MLVAEGVETAEQLAHVRAAGAPLAQGYLLAWPGDPGRSWTTTPAP